MFKAFVCWSTNNAPCWITGLIIELFTLICNKHWKMLNPEIEMSQASVLACNPMMLRTASFVKSKITRFNKDRNINLTIIVTKPSYWKQVGADPSAESF